MRPIWSTAETRHFYRPGGAGCPARASARAAYVRPPLIDAAAWTRQRASTTRGLPHAWHALRRTDSPITVCGRSRPRSVRSQTVLTEPHQGLCLDCAELVRHRRIAPAYTPGADGGPHV